MAGSRSKTSAPRKAPHVMPILLSIATIGLLGLALIQETPPQAGQQETPPPAAQTIDIGIEHRSSSTVLLTYTTDAAPGFLEISHEGEELNFINLPENWKLRAVRLARMQDVSKDDPKEGYVRWHLPPKAVLSLIVPTSPAKMRVFNVSASPLELRVRRIDLKRNAVATDIYLLGKNEPFFIPD